MKNSKITLCEQTANRHLSKNFRIDDETFYSCNRNFQCLSDKRNLFPIFAEKIKEDEIWTFVLCNNEGRSNRKSNQGQIITKKMDVCRWQISWIVGLLLFLSYVIGDFDKRDYLKREHTLVKPYSG